MRKIILGISLIIFMSFASYAQSIKTYTGNYSEAEENGQATYQYYENDDYERIYNGDFIFTKDDRVVKGKFKDNLKDGLWTSKSSYSILTGHFNMGLPNGEWLYENPEAEEFVIREKATYKDGKLLGKFYYKSDPFYVGDFEINGEINDEGYLDGIWTVKWENVEDIRKYKNGILYFRLVRDTETGFVAYKVDSTNFVNEILSNLDKSNMTSNYGNMKYVIQNSNNKEIEKDAIYVPKGDYRDYSSKRSNNYWEYVHNDFIIANIDKWPRRFLGIEKGDKVVNNYYKRIVINFDQTEEGQLLKLFENYIAKGDTFFKNNLYENAIDEYNHALNIKKEEVYPKSQIERAKEISTINSKFNDIMSQGDYCFRNKEYDKAIEHYQLALEMKDEVRLPHSAMPEDDPQKMIDRIKKVKLEEKIKSMKFDIYVFEYRNSYELFKEKPNLNSAYSVIKNYQVQGLDQEYEHLLIQTKVIDKLRKLRNENSKKIEKQLKGETDYQTILNILNIKLND